MTNRSDNFTGSNSADSISTGAYHPSDGGSDWIVYHNTWGIDSNQCYQSGLLFGDNLGIGLQSSVANVAVQITNTVKPIAGSNIAVAFRIADDNNFMVAYATSSDALFYKKVSGSYTQLATQAISGFADGDVYKVTADAANLLTFYRNGSPLVSVTDATHSTNTIHGLFYSSNTNEQRFDDFSITALTGGSASRRYYFDMIGH